MLAEKVKKFITANQLLSENESVLVGFSGGADSMCLLHILNSLSYKVFAAHLNHGLRGSEAEKDEKTAQEFCLKNNIPFFVTHKNIHKIAKETGVSEETAGRNERYSFFKTVAAENGIGKIATAHNKNDNAETMLMHIIRGTGSDGLSGIPNKRDNIVRPLLSCTRNEIEKYCQIHQLPYVTDSSNLEKLYTRNKIRLDLMPELEKYNPNIISSLTNLCELTQADKCYFNRIIDDLIADKTSVEIEKIVTLHDAVLFRVIKRLCCNAGISPEYKQIKIISDALKVNNSGKKFDLPGGYIEISCGMLYAGKHENIKFRHTITSDSDITIGKYHIKSSTEILSDKYFIIPDGSEVLIRSRLDGDKIKIRGMTKKISDIFIDRKIPSNIRDSIPILTVDKEIHYIFGMEKSDLSISRSKNSSTYVLNISNKEYTNE